MISNSPLIKACILSPVIVWVFVAISYFWFRHGDLDNIGEFPTTSLGSLLYIAGMSVHFYLIVLVVNVLIGFPFALLLKKFDVLNWMTIVIGGTVFGGLILYVVGTEFSFLSVVFGGSVGFCVAVVFSLIAGVGLKINNSAM